jgi:hypothetical protein
MLQDGRSRVQISIRSLDFLHLPNTSSLNMGLGLTVCNRNEYQTFSWEVKGGRRVSLTTSQPSVTPLSK